MSIAVSRRSPIRTLLLWAAPVTWLGCGGGGGTDVVLPALSVTTTTEGVELDADGYSLLVDGASGRPIGATATLVIEQLDEGQHTLELSGLAPNCAAQGDNPRTITVQSNATARADFTVRCVATSGSIDVSVATTGDGSDPDGYGLLLDGGDRGVMAVNATTSLTGLTPGSHTIGLTGIAGNCAVSGANPRPVTVPAGGTVTVAFSVTCSNPPPGTGSVQVSATTSGAPPDPDGYTVAVDNAGARPLPVNGSISIGNLTAGSHTVTLNGLAANCTAADNPRTVTIIAGQTTPADFAISCTATGPSAGQVRITATTTGSSRDPDGYSVSVDGGATQPLDINGSRTINGLTAGAHTVTLGGVATNCTVAGALERPITITAGQTATVAFAVSCAAVGGSVNFRIERMYLTQSTQTGDGSVPLVQGREAYLRVFVTASTSNSVRAPVRVRFFQNGSSTPTQTLTIPPGDGSTPTGVQEGTLSSSWNLRVPAALIQPNTTVLADVDPENAVAEPNEGDNSFPATGTPRPLSVRSVPPLTIRFVPVRQAANGLTGVVGNPNELLELARRMHPLNEIRTSVHTAYTTTTQLPLEATNENEAWIRVLEEIELMRLIEGSPGEHFFGMVRVNYGSGVNGIGYVGAPSAVGSDDPADVAQVVAHELGHNWGRWHSPCGNPPDLDPTESYPYSNGRIGVYGFDVARERVRPPSDPDIMGYCPNPWISDYTYSRVLSFRAAGSSSSTMARGSQLSMIVWGRIQNGRPVLEPAFQVVTRPSLPSKPGPYTVEATAADGRRIFSLSFDATPIADKGSGARHFAFAVPLDPALAAQVSTLRLQAAGAPLAAVAQSRSDLTRGVRPEAVSVRREGNGVTLEWDVGAHPMIVVRDPDTGEVLSIAKGGRTRIPTGKAELHLEVSDGVRSYGLRRAISR